MYSINLSLLAKSNYVPEGHIINVKQLSDNVIRLQIAERRESDKLPVVHTNSRTFAASHADSIAVDITMSDQNGDTVIIPKNFKVFGNSTNVKKSYNILQTFVNLVRVILELNEYEVYDGFKLN